MGCGAAVERMKIATGRDAPAAGAAEATPTPEPQPGGTDKGKHRVVDESKFRTSKQVSEIMKGKFQVLVDKKWKEYKEEEDALLKKAFLVGQPKCTFTLRGHSYEYNFQTMYHKNVDKGKERRIQAPTDLTAPETPLLPLGPMVVCTVPDPIAPSMEIEDPSYPGRRISIAIPPKSQPGMRIGVPVPAPGEDPKDVVKRQQEWSAGTKLAAGAAAVGALAVGGVILGEHLCGGALNGWDEGLAADGDAVADTGAADAARSAGDVAAGAAGEVGDAAADAAGDAADGAGGDAVAAAAVAVEKSDVAVHLAEEPGDTFADAGDWFGGITEDAGDFVFTFMSS